MIRNFQNLINNYTRPPAGDNPAAPAARPSAQAPAGPNVFRKLPTELLQLIQMKVANNPHAKNALGDMSRLLVVNQQSKAAIEDHAIVNAYLTRQRQLINTLAANRHASAHAPGLASADSERWLDQLLRASSRDKTTMLSAGTLSQLNQQQQFFLLNGVRRHHDAHTPALFAGLSQQLPQMDETVRRGVVDAIQKGMQHPQTGGDYRAAGAGLARHFTLLSQDEQKQLSAQAHQGLGQGEGSALLSSYLQHHGELSGAEQATLFNALHALAPEKQPLAWQQLASGCANFTPARCEDIFDNLMAGLEDEKITPHQLIDAIYAMGSGLEKLDSARHQRLAQRADTLPPGQDAELYSTLAPVMDRLPSSLQNQVMAKVIQCGNPGSRLYALSRLTQHHDKLSQHSQQQLHANLRGGFDIEDHLYAGIPLGRWDSHNLNKGNVLKNLVPHYPQLPAEVQHMLLTFIGGINRQSGVSENVKASLIAGLAERFSQATPQEAESLPWQALTAAVSTMENPVVQAQTAQRISNSLHVVFNQYVQDAMV